MLVVDGLELPAPKSVTYSKNKLWSQNAGRLDSGYFVGDLIAVKRKYEVVFPPLTPEQLSDVLAACNNDFADVEITNAEGSTDRLDVYFGDVTVESYSWCNGINYAVNASVSIIER